MPYYYVKKSEEGTNSPFVTRPVDGDVTGGAVCDIGAIEATETIDELYVPIVVR